MPGWEKVLLAAAGSGGGGGGVSISLDVNELVNPVASYFNESLTETFTVVRPDKPVSVYPATWTEDQFKQIMDADNVSVEWGDSLEWKMADDSWWPGDESSYTLKCNFQTVHLGEPEDPDEATCPAGGVYLLHNLQPFVELNDSGWGWKVHVACSIGDTYKVSAGVSGIPVIFDVAVAEGDGDSWRTVRRQFTIDGQGNKDQVE